MQILDELALMVSAHVAMKFDHKGYRKIAKQGTMATVSFEFGDMEGVMHTETPTKKE